MGILRILNGNFCIWSRFDKDLWIFQRFLVFSRRILRIIRDFNGILEDFKDFLGFFEDSCGFSGCFMEIFAVD